MRREGMRGKEGGEEWRVRMKKVCMEMGDGDGERM